MAVYLIVAIHVDRALGRIDAVRWGEVDPDGMHFVEGTAVADVLEVVDALYAGNSVYAHRTMEGRIVPGPRVRHVHFEDGAEGIDLDDADLEAGHHWGVADVF
ncbi:MAG: hypothetical protein JWP38_3146 [Herbaspirillum sp.]|jgi:hypothetical protein|nr:hypothetical protein [Herbaspirillum sp.]